MRPAEPFVFDGTNLPDRSGVVNATARRMAVNTRGQGQFILKPGEGLIATLDGPRVVRRGAIIIPRLDGTWRVQNPTIEFEGGDVAAESDAAWTAPHK